MQVSGQIKTLCPPDILVSTLHDAGVLTGLLPKGSRLEKASDGGFAFTLIKDVGPLRLTLPGHMTVSATGEGLNHTIAAHAAHLIGGKVDLDLDLAIEQQGAQTLLAYSGNLNATGLAGRVLRDRKGQARAVLKTLLLRLKAEAERTMRQGVQAP